MTSDEDHCVELAKNGDQSGLQALYMMYFNPIYRFCYWQTNRSDDAEDLTQDIFIEVARSIRGFTGKASFKNWLYTLAKNKISHWLRQKYQLPTTELFEMLPDRAEWIEPENDELKMKVLQTLFARLSATESKVMKRRYLQSYTIKETAKSLKISEANVKVIAFRSLKKLKKMTECNFDDTLFNDEDH